MTFTITNLQSVFLFITIIWLYFWTHYSLETAKNIQKFKKDFVLPQRVPCIPHVFFSALRPKLDTAKVILTEGAKSPLWTMLAILDHFVSWLLLNSCRRRSPTPRWTHPMYLSVSRLHCWFLPQPGPPANNKPVLHAAWLQHCFSVFRRYHFYARQQELL